MYQKGGDSVELERRKIGLRQTGNRKQESVILLIEEADRQAPAVLELTRDLNNSSQGQEYACTDKVLEPGITANQFEGEGRKLSFREALQLDLDNI